MLDNPEGVAEVAGETGDALVRLSPLLGRLDPAEPAHHRLPVHHRIELIGIPLAPFAKPQPRRLRDRFSH
jgi:hypothetical protein